MTVGETPVARMRRWLEGNSRWFYGEHLFRQDVRDLLADYDRKDQELAGAGLRLASERHAREAAETANRKLSEALSRLEAELKDALSCSPDTTTNPPCLSKKLNSQTSTA